MRLRTGGRRDLACPFGELFFGALDHGLDLTDLGLQFRTRSRDVAVKQRETFVVIVELLSDLRPELLDL